jgi:hypothetical protein
LSIFISIHSRNQYNFNREANSIVCKHEYIRFRANNCQQPFTSIRRKKSGWTKAVKVNTMVSAREGGGGQKVFRENIISLYKYPPLSPLMFAGYVVLCAASVLNLQGNEHVCKLVDIGIFQYIFHPSILFPIHTSGWRTLREFSDFRDFCVHFRENLAGFFF